MSDFISALRAMSDFASHESDAAYSTFTAMWILGFVGFPIMTIGMIVLAVLTWRPLRQYWTGKAQRADEEWAAWREARRARRAAILPENAAAVDATTRPESVVVTENGGLPETGAAAADADADRGRSRVPRGGWGRLGPGKWDDVPLA
ncbi:hypothetical protein QBC47DRAFT_401799 [Echria macrotheca]|uniref:Uncharacterized protein n=1 Tax=Echria macrotheca TaxID=438768 RepID=A0AAJ0BF23_9PEZI|nr:hypothetical protein QBC47DRAFT_401799 [Echria macrotheca]